MHLIQRLGDFLLCNMFGKRMARLIIECRGLRTVNHSVYNARGIRAEEVSKIILSFLSKNVIVGAPHTIWKMKAMDFVSLPPNDSLGMKELGIAIP
ncbi:hypothetical protein QL285_056511 [Trifolium repens]|nr:hypothetical protein QL285_056511 [Trifolium repens]